MALQRRQAPRVGIRFVTAFVDRIAGNIGSADALLLLLVIFA